MSIKLTSKVSTLENHIASSLPFSANDTMAHLDVKTRKLAYDSWLHRRLREREVQGRKPSNDRRQPTFVIGLHAIDCG